jgi:dTDP-4-amino-4,6-dideoxygalactose transaminase
VQASLHYPVPPHLQPWPVDLGVRQGELPVAEASAARQLSLPIAPELEDAEIDRVCAEVHGFFG